MSMVDSFILILKIYSRIADFSVRTSMVCVRFVFFSPLGEMDIFFPLALYTFLLNEPSSKRPLDGSITASLKSIRPGRRKLRLLSVFRVLQNPEGGRF